MSQELADLYELMRELDIAGAPRLEMIGDPERGIAVLRHALRAPKIRNRGGFAVANWRAGFDPRSSPRPVLELLGGEPGPPSLSALEYQWSRGPSPLGELLLRTMAIAIAKAGGFESLKRTFHEIEHFDDDGERMSA